MDEVKLLAGSSLYSDRTNVYLTKSMLTLVALNWDIVTDFLRIHVILALDVKYHVYDKHRRIEPDEQEDDGTRSDM